MATTTIHIKTDTTTRDKAAKVAEDFGISLTTLVNRVLEQVGRTKKVNLDLDETPTPWMIEQLRKSEEDVKAGRVTSFKTPKEAAAYFRKRAETHEAIEHPKHRDHY